MKRKSSKTAFCGIAAALSVVLMLLTAVIPFLTYIMPILTGLLVYAALIGAGRKWALGLFSCVGILSLILLTDKEAALTYLLIFGYYPILKGPIEKLPKAAAWALKFLLFNAAAVAIGLLGVWVFGLSTDDYREFGRLTIPLYLLLANITFFLYDVAFTKNQARFDAAPGACFTRPAAEPNGLLFFRQIKI